MEFIFKKLLSEKGRGTTGQIILAAVLFLAWSQNKIENRLAAIEGRLGISPVAASAGNVFAHRSGGGTNLAEIQTP